MDNIKVEIPQSETLEYEPMVMMPREVYDVLQNDSFMLNAILNGLFDNAALAWGDESFSFSDSAMNPILKAFMPDTYQVKLDILKQEKERKAANGTD